MLKFFSKFRLCKIHTFFHRLFHIFFTVFSSNCDLHISMAIKQFKVQVSSYFFFHLLFLISSLYFKEEVMPCVEHSPCNPEALSSNPTLSAIASHAGVFRGACFSSLLTNACSTKDNFPFLSLANHNVLSKFWKVDLDRREI